LNETHQHGNRVVRSYAAPYYFYVEDSKGEFTSLYGKKLKRLDFDSRDEFKRALDFNKTKYESDLNPLDKILMQHYYDRAAPKLRIGLFDIEVDYDDEIGFSTVRDPYAPINAITVYIPDRQKYITIAVPPKWYLELHGTDTSALSKYGDPLPEFADIGFYATERDLLLQFLNIIDDLDVLSGWNSDFFDIPYIIQRILRVLGKHHAKRMCFEGCQEPQEREVEHFGSMEITYNLSGRVHLDYLNLFKKFTFGGRESYSLAAIAEEELDIPKLHYDGTLANLYTADFVTFIRYNIRDVEILHRLDEKFKFIQLANTMAHESTVLIPAVFGSVQYIDTAIVNYAHNVLDRIVSDKVHKPTIPVEGALVVTPQVGMHKNIFSVDINSLYPNTYRTLNLSPECIVGQFTNFEADWRGIRAGDLHDHILEFDDPASLGIDSETLSATGDVWQQVLREKKWSITAYGTVIDQSKGPGVIPRLLGDWYADRKKKQKLSKEHQAKAKAWLDNGGKKTDKEYIDEITLYEYYDLLQYTKKISLNSLYGATLNEFCRFHDPRLGASTTGSGRQITTHMIQTLSKLITGIDYKLVKEKKVDGGADYSIPYESHVVYGDTDSGYIRLPDMGENATIDEMVEVADSLADLANATFPDFTKEAFFCTEEFSTHIKCGREVVAKKGVFLAKKKYMLNVADFDGVRLKPDDKKAFKAMGMELAKSDTPKVIRAFLKKFSIKLLSDATYEELEEFVLENRSQILSDSLILGMPKSCNNLDSFTQKYNTIVKTGQGSVTIPGHVRAAINYNEMLFLENDVISPKIKSGDKIKVYYIKDNSFGYKSIALPADTSAFPSWFAKHFDIDTDLMEDKLIVSKLQIILGPLGLNVPTPQNKLINDLLSFD
jgi:DNA polymerase elongation subunit (family B)